MAFVAIAWELNINCLNVALKLNVSFVATIIIPFCTLLLELLHGPPLYNFLHGLAHLLLIGLLVLHPIEHPLTLPYQLLCDSLDLGHLPVIRIPQINDYRTLPLPLHLC